MTRLGGGLVRNGTRHPPPPWRGLWQGSEDRLLDEPQGGVVEPGQRPWRLDLGADDGEIAAPITEHTQAALLGLAAELGKSTSRCYLGHGKSPPVVPERWKRVRDGYSFRFWNSAGGLRVAGCR
jgi:hypothetical protein